VSLVLYMSSGDDYLNGTIVKISMIWSTRA